MNMNISLIGIGLMGAPMLQKLIEAGYRPTIWNRTRSKIERFAHQTIIADTVDEALKPADVAILMLENGQVVSDVIFKRQTYLALKPGALLIDMGSISPSLAKEHANLIHEHGALYLDAPVSGGTIGAEQGTLAIMAGGSKAGFKIAEPVFNHFGKALYMGPAGCGQITKLANQTIVGITIGAVSEALLLASKGGANPEAVREILSGGFASSRILELHGKRMIDRHFEPGATSRVQLKDLAMITEEARAIGLSLPLAQRTYDSYLSHVANGRENLDHSSLILELEHLNQYQLETNSDNA